MTVNQNILRMLSFSLAQYFLPKLDPSGQGHGEPFMQEMFDLFYKSALGEI